MSCFQVLKKRKWRRREERCGSSRRGCGSGQETSYDLIESAPLESQSLDRRSGWPLSLQSHHHHQSPSQYQRRPLVMLSSSPGGMVTAGGLQQSFSVTGAEENQFSVIESPSTSHKLANFLSRPFRSNPLKRTKSVSKLDRKRSALESNNINNSSNCGNGGAAIGGIEGPAWSTPALNSKNIRNSRSHESLLSYSTTTHAIDLANSAVSGKNPHHYNSNTVSGKTAAVGGCTVTPLHSSVLGTPHCFQIRTDSGATKYYACRTAAERDRWLECLNRTMLPNQDQVRRQENSLQIWILEAKGVPVKRKYYCELCLDNTLYSRTTSKIKTELCFWGEQFEINHLPNLETVCINLYREADRKKKKDRNTLVGYVQIPVHALSARHPVEKWYCVTGAEKTAPVKGEALALRVKAKYQSVTILPLRAYDGFLQYLQRDYLPLCLALEPSVSVKAKEDFATSMVRVLHKQGQAKEFLCDLIMSEVRTLDNEHLMFRGNSLATKAMESYMKLVGDQYLHDTLSEFIQSILESDEDCEVDPQKLSTNLSLLPKHQETLTNKVHLAWGKIVNSFYDFPIELRQVFFELRQRLHRCDRMELADYLISSSIFLRLLCPAILSPSLFNLVQEYPTGRTARSLTLIAKTIQTLANFTRFGGKEHYMEFMNKFVEGECDHMRQYLMRISSPLNKDCLSRGLEWEGCIDLGKELSLIHGYLTECWVNIDIKRYREAGLHDLQKTLEQLTEAVQNPASPLNSGYPSGSLSPISPISDYENNNNTADDSSPTSENAINYNNYAAQTTIPTTGGGGRSYGMYNNNNNNSISRNAITTMSRTPNSPLRHPQQSPLTPINSGNNENEQQQSSNAAVRIPASNLQTDDDYVWYSALDDNLRVRHMGMVVQQNRAASKQQHQQKQISKGSSARNQRTNSLLNTAELVAGNGIDALSFVDDHQSDYFSRPATEEEDEGHQSDEYGPPSNHNHHHNHLVERCQNESRKTPAMLLHNNSLPRTDHIHGATAGSSPNGATTASGQASSGYQSMNYSTSNSSSPVDTTSSTSSGASSTGTGNRSQASSTSVKSIRQQRQHNNTNNNSCHRDEDFFNGHSSRRAAPLAIANPLYSMQTVPLIQQKAPSYSLPDIHHQSPLSSAEYNNNNNFQNNHFQPQRRLCRERPTTTADSSPHHFGGGGCSSFEEAEQQQQHNRRTTTVWAYPPPTPQQHGYRQQQWSNQTMTTPENRGPTNALSHSLTNSSGSHRHGGGGETDPSASAATLVHTSPALIHKSPLPRTNPRYCMGASPLSPRLDGSGSSGIGSGPCSAAAPTVPPPVRRTRTEYGIGVRTGGISDLEAAEDAELSQKFIQELEAMKRRLEETQSLILTSDHESSSSAAPSNGTSSIIVDGENPGGGGDSGISVATSSSLKRRTQDDKNHQARGAQRQNGEGKPAGWTDQVKPIICRLKAVEHELQEELSSSMKKQQQIIEAQQKRIELLVSANELLMATLTQMKDRTGAGPEDDDDDNNQDQDPISSPEQPLLAVSARHVAGHRHHDNNNHSKESGSGGGGFASTSSSLSAASSLNEEHNHHRGESGSNGDRRWNDNPAVGSSSSTTSGGPSDLSSVDSYNSMLPDDHGGSPTNSPPELPPPQPSLPAPVLPHERLDQQQQCLAMKTTQC